MQFGLREIVFILLLLGVPAAAYFFVFEPRNEQIAELNQEIKLKQDKLTHLESVTRNIPDMNAEIARLTEAIELIEERLPDMRNLEEVLHQVWQLAGRQRLTPKSIRPDKTVRKHSYSELPIQMEIVGDFDGFYSFLLEVEKLPRIMQLKEMTLEKNKGKDAEQGQMTATLNISVFFEDDDSADYGGSATSRRRL